MLLQILNKIPDVIAQLLREDSDSSRTCLQMVVNMCYAMIIAFPRSDSMYDPVIRAMKVPSYRNFSLLSFSCVQARTHTCIHTHTYLCACLPVFQLPSFVRLLNSFLYWDFKKSERRFHFFFSPLSLLRYMKHKLNLLDQKLVIVQNLIRFTKAF